MNYQAQVLCIDDEPELIALVKQVLKTENIHVIGAANGREGLSTLRKQLPDAVILDIMMPGMDGWEVYRQIRADNNLKHVPVVILTARNSLFEEVVARERAGVDDYLTKPFLNDVLKKTIFKVLGLPKL
jgi:DNA-binding response OmpR family regulator